VNLPTTLANARGKSDRSGVRAFFLSMGALSVAFVLALYSGAAARLGNLLLASSTALASLVVAGWVAVTLVPVLAKRTPLRWISYRMEYRITRQGWIYIGTIVIVALAAINTGNNLLFLILACLIASILMSGILSSITLAGVAMRLLLPEQIFAGQTVRSMVELSNQKLTLPSFSLRVEGVSKKTSTTAAILATPVYFPYLPKRDSVQQAVPLQFPRRGLYRQEAFRIVTTFPFGFLQKARRVDLASEALVYPPVDATSEFLEVMSGIQGAIESLAKGRGQDLYALRDYQPMDSARHVHWKASARAGSLMVREFAREDDSRVVLIFDPHSAAGEPGSSEKEKARFEQSVALCAAIAWDLYERGASLQFLCGESELPQAPGEQNVFAVLRSLALVNAAPLNASSRLAPAQNAEAGSFQVVVTSQPRGSIPAEVWNSCYIVFAAEVAD
jgi:uncharacterized protein (DUF58 family)